MAVDAFSVTCKIAHCIHGSLLSWQVGFITPCPVLPGKQFQKRTRRVNGDALVAAEVQESSVPRDKMGNLSGHGGGEYEVVFFVVGHTPHRRVGDDDAGLGA